MIDKTIRCRYFDEQGRPSKHKCGRGIKLCRFAHPEDPEWGGAIPARDRAPSMSPPRSFGGHEPPPRREHEERRWEENNGRSSSGLDHPSSSSTMNVDHPQRPADGSSAWGAPPSEPTFRTKHSAPSSLPPSMSTDSSTEWPRASPAEVFAHHDARAQKKRVEQLMSLFQQLASVMNETTQHASLAELENQKVQSFTVLSNSLSQISQPATAAVAPGLMSAISSHKHAQERVDAGFAKVGSIWSDIISSAAAGLAVELDAQVDQALERLRRDAKVMVDEMVREAFKKEDEEDVKPVISSYEQVDGKVAGKRKSIVLEHDEDSRKRARMGSASTPSPAPAPAAPPSQGPAGTDEMLKLMHAMMAQLQRNTTSTTSTAPPPAASSSSAPVYASHRTASPTPHQSAPYGRTTPRRRSPPPPTGPHGYGKPSYERPARQLSGGYDYNTSPPRDAYPQHGSYGGHRPPPPAYPPYEGHAYYERNGR